jgi:hypothetical protein
MEGEMAKAGKGIGKRLWERVVRIVADPASDVLSDAVLAGKLGIEEDVLKDMLTDEVVAEAMARRVRDIESSELAEVDRAMLARAREGHVGAARLLYARVASKAESEGDDGLPSLEELEAELKAARGKTLRP